ncbi:TadE/TadG family type IV pilus assembly protein [Actinomadura flavalba]|uniref:TadE/TadG family type IV pilus assembly protein n=1 Tax=Actinomadura flavalba TaxID=1120938 RepID=UPI001F0B2B65|nr:TadE/TadG family type IV pilus assembly protein [Actinomadura flavalba]
MRRDDGSMSLEMVLATPLFVMFLLLLAGAGRLVDARSQVDGAARDAARAASVARSAGGAQSMGRAAANANLGAKNWCSGGPGVSIGGDFRAGGEVVVTITCDVDLGELGFVGFPGTKRIEGRAVAPVDEYTYRGGGER